MPSSQSTVDKLLAALADAGPITTRKMFGEYCLYLGPKVVGLVSDDEFFLKPTTIGKRLAKDAAEKPPYPGAKPYLFIRKAWWANHDWMCGLITATADELPSPKKRKRS
jgi:TfoX/Sxy family transcriptional regulator of competence genes